MGFHNHVVLKCHTCKRRHVSGATKKGGSWEKAERTGWVFLVNSKHGRFIWLCPACARKHAAPESPPP